MRDALEFVASLFGCAVVYLIGTVIGLVPLALVVYVAVSVAQ